MRRPQFIARQSRCPEGLLGGLVARIMARETAPENKKALELLNLQPADHALEIGFGHGRTIAKVAEAVSQGFVAGVDISERMVRMAARYNHKLLKEGRIRLLCGDCEALPYPDNHFDKIYSVHTVYFWPHPARALQSIKRLLKKDGTFLLAFKADGEKMRSEFPGNIYKFYSAEELRSLVCETGFGQVSLVNDDLSGRSVLYLLARG